MYIYIKNIHILLKCIFYKNVYCILVKSFHTSIELKFSFTYRNVSLKFILNRSHVKEEVLRSKLYLQQQKILY